MMTCLLWGHTANFKLDSGTHPTDEKKTHDKRPSVYAELRISQAGDLIIRCFRVSKRKIGIKKLERLAETW